VANDPKSIGTMQKKRGRDAATGKALEVAPEEEEDAPSLANAKRQAVQVASDSSDSDDVGSSVSDTIAWE
jgi:hypothetical protein